MRKVIILLVLLLLLALAGLFLPSILGGGGITNFTPGNSAITPEDRA